MIGCANAEDVLRAAGPMAERTVSPRVFKGMAFIQTATRPARLDPDRLGESGLPLEALCHPDLSMSREWLGRLACGG